MHSPQTQRLKEVAQQFLSAKIKELSTKNSPSGKNILQEQRENKDILKRKVRGVATKPTLKE